MELQFSIKESNYAIDTKEFKKLMKIPLNEEITSIGFFPSQGVGKSKIRVITSKDISKSSS